MPDRPANEFETGLNALWVATRPEREAAARVTFLLEHHGALTVRAPGILKPQSKLAPLLASGDELTIRLARGRGGSQVLTGASLAQSHPVWRSELAWQALLWFMLECACAATAARELNAQTYQLIVNILRHPPARHPPALACFAAKFLRLHGLLFDLAHCAVDGHALGAGETCHVLPRGEGLVGLAAYNARYARSAGLLRLEPGRLARWRACASEPLLAALQLEGDGIDAALWLELAAGLVGDAVGHRLKSAGFLAEQWQLPEPRALLAAQRD